MSVYWKSVLYSEDNYLRFSPDLSNGFGPHLDPDVPGDRKDFVIYHIVVVYNELLNGIFLQSTKVSVDVLTPTRFFIASWLPIVRLLISVVSFVYGAFQLPETFLPK